MKWGAANSRRAIAPEDRVQQIEAAIFLIPFITYAYFYQGSDQSIACRFDLMRSMLEKRVLWIDDFCGFNTDDIITFHGHIYSVKAPGTSYTALIPWLIFRIALLPLSAAHEPAYWALVTYLTTADSSRWWSLPGSGRKLSAGIYFAPCNPEFRIIPYMDPAPVQRRLERIK